MTKTYAQLMKQIESLSREAETLKRKEVDGVVTRIKEAIEAYGLTAADLGLTGARTRTVTARKGTGSGRRAPSGDVKFRDNNGNVWGGRGPRPKWLRDALTAGKQLSDFAV